MSVIAAAGYYGSGEILDASAGGESRFDDQLIEIRKNRVKLKVSSDTTRSGRYVLTWPDQSSIGIGKTIEADDESVTRRITNGSIPSNADGTVAIDNWSPETTPLSMGMKYDSVDFNTELGKMNAWLVKGDRDTWAIGVHGRNRQRGAQAETLRPLRTIVENKYPYMSISYRNDYGAPRSPDGYSHWGGAEWKDLQSAMKYAEQQGAKKFVLFGWSMGAMVILEFLHNSKLAKDVVGLVFDSPMLNLDSAVRQELRSRQLPAALTAPLLLAAQVRSKGDLSSLSVRSNPPSIRPPLLLMHGGSDRIIPVDDSRELAANSSRLNWKIDYQEFPEANHTGEWNSDSTRYETCIDRYLSNL